MPKLHGRQVKFIATRTYIPIMFCVVLNIFGNSLLYICLKVEYSPDSSRIFEITLTSARLYKF